jgi:hypothetical protein
VNPPGDRALLLFRRDLILDLVVGRLRNDLLLHQLILPLVRTALDDLLGVRIANSSERLELLGSGCVDVNEIGFLRSLD